MHKKSCSGCHTQFSLVSMVITIALCLESQRASKAHYLWHRLPAPKPFSLQWRPFSLQIIWYPKDKRIKNRRILKQKWLEAKSPPKIKQKQKSLRWSALDEDPTTSYKNKQEPHAGMVGVTMAPQICHVQCLGKRSFLDVIKFRGFRWDYPVLSRWVQNAITRERRSGLTHTVEKVTWRERQRSEWHGQRSRNTKEFWAPQEARRGNKQTLPLGLWREDGPTDTLSLDIWPVEYFKPGLW